MKYKTTRGKDIFKENPELSLEPEFSLLTDRQMRFVIYFSDPDSPYASYPERERRQRAALAAGWHPRDNQHESLDTRGQDVITGKVPAIEAAIVKYRDILDIDRLSDMEMIEMTQQQINNIKAVMSKPTDDVDELKKRNALIQSLPDLKKTLKDLQSSSGMIVASNETEDDTPKELSMIDRISQENGL